MHKNNNMKSLNLEPFSKLYQITEDGQLWSNRKQKFCKGAINSVGYKMYWLQPNRSRGRFYMASRLTALTYIGDPPTLKHEINHIDHNKLNNHYSNLEWVTHSQNIKKSYDGGYRVALGRLPGFITSEQTKMKQSDAKKKRVEVIDRETGEKITYNSIEDATNHPLIKYRRKLERIIKAGNNHKDVLINILS